MNTKFTSKSSLKNLRTRIKKANAGKTKQDEIERQFQKEREAEKLKQHNE